MKDLKEIIIEKLRINKDTGKDICSIENIENFIDPNGYTYIGHKLAIKNGKLLFWALAWNYLKKNGPMRKLDLMNAMREEGLTYANPTSNVSTFATLNKQGIICGVKGKLEARDPKDWNI